MLEGYNWKTCSFVVSSLSCFNILSCTRQELCYRGNISPRFIRVSVLLQRSTQASSSQSYRCDVRLFWANGVFFTHKTRYCNACCITPWCITPNFWLPNNFLKYFCNLPFPPSYSPGKAFILVYNPRPWCITPIAGRKKSYNPMG